METASLLASQSYGTTQTSLKPDPASAKLGADDQSKNFFVEYATNVVGTIQKGETLAQQGMVGQADPTSVVQALAQTELAVETAVTIRDKIVEAYQEILRMPV